MSSDEARPAYLDDAQRFRDALGFTEARTGSAGRLIEKDYYCSMILREFAGVFDQGLVFKGGTCLSKVHMSFYRLSEDLDFALPMETNARRSDRRAKIEPFKGHFAALPARLSRVRIADPLKGSNVSTQYIGRYCYRSVVTGEDEFIKVEVSLREPVCDPTERRPAHTMLLDPYRNAPAVAPISVAVLSFREAYAEKFRAALTRHGDPAIRDFYDIDHAVRAGAFDPADGEFLRLVTQKLAVPGNDPIDVSEAKLTVLRRQVETQLKPFLRAKDYEGFDLNRAFDLVARVAESI